MISKTDKDEERRQHALLDIVEERQRQIAKEGFLLTDDDKAAKGSLAKAASFYARHAFDPAHSHAHPPQGWPWDAHWWKRTNPRRDLVKAGALILAEIEKLARAEEKKTRNRGSNRHHYFCTECGAEWHLTSNANPHKGPPSACPMCVTVINAASTPPC